MTKTFSKEAQRHNQKRHDRAFAARLSQPKVKEEEPPRVAVRQQSACLQKKIMILAKPTNVAR